MKQKTFYLTEIGYDTSIETENSLIEVANTHCNSYTDRKQYLPINTLSKAIKYFKENGFNIIEK